MNAPAQRPGSRVGLTIGAAAVFGGLWLLLDAWGVGVPPFKRLWPALFFLAAAAAVYDYLSLTRLPRAAGWALAWTGFGILGLALTLGYTDWRKFLDWLPSFPAILGVALLVTWLADRRKNTNLLLASGVLVGLAVVGFAARFDWLRRLLPSAQVIWAVLLVVGGGYLAWRTISSMRR